MESSENVFQLKNKSVLVLGIYLSNKENNIEHIVNQFNISSQWQVVQKWIGIGGKSQVTEVNEVTVMEIQEKAPKFVLLNKVLSSVNMDSYDFIIICDDDITLPDCFLETYLDMIIRYDFALAQPARTHNSYIDLHFVEQLCGLKARSTRFVEIGPLFSVRKDVYSTIFPFDEINYMGWGYEYVWSYLIGKLGLRMGIIDATPVDHSMRKPVTNYIHGEAKKSEKDYLSENLHLSKEEAFRILESYA